MITLQFLATALVVVPAPGAGVIHTLAPGPRQGRRAAFCAAIFAALAGRLAVERA